jgi:hypothetical protein
LGYKGTRFDKINDILILHPQFMMFAVLKNALLLSFALSTVQATTYNVSVGQNGNTFTPDHVSGVVPGDLVAFHFYPSGHAVAIGTFDSPCTLAEGAFEPQRWASLLISTS